MPNGLGNTMEVFDELCSTIHKYSKFKPNYRNNAQDRTLVYEFCVTVPTGVKGCYELCMHIHCHIPLS